MRVCVYTDHRINLFNILRKVGYFAKLISVVAGADNDERHVGLVGILEALLLNLDRATDYDVVAV